MDTTHSYESQSALFSEISHRRVSASWWVRDLPTTVQVKKHFIKRRFATDETILALRDAGDKLGIKDAKNWWPSNESDLFFEPWHTRKMNYSTQCHMPETLPGAWQEALPAFGVGPWYEYDLNSAYAWAGSIRELPCHWTAWAAQPWKPGSHGIWLCWVLASSYHSLPPHIRAALGGEYPVWVTHEEINSLELTVSSIRGIEFGAWEDLRPRFDAVRNAVGKNRDVWKSVFRKFWGRWLSPTGPLHRGHKNNTSRVLPNLFFDPARALFILSRVRLRLAEVAADAVHIYVDAVITREKLATSDEIGGWKLKNTYTGMTIRHPGSWVASDPAGRPVEKHAGECRRLA